MEYFDKAFEQAADGKAEVSLSLIGGALKKLMPKFKVKKVWLQDAWQIV